MSFHLITLNISTVYSQINEQNIKKTTKHDSLHINILLKSFEIFNEVYSNYITYYTVTYRIIFSLQSNYILQRENRNMSLNKFLMRILHSYNKNIDDNMYKRYDLIWLQS